MKQRVYYRPAWTCGRYNKDKTVAIYYNLIEGFSYFFEENSAIVIGFILSIKRNDSFTLDEISKKTGFAKESLLDFLNQLDELKIISSIEPTAEFTSEYRKKCAEHKCSNAVNTVKRVEEKLPFYVSNAEMEYTNKVNGITGVMLELTYNCSEKCVHCYNPGATRNDGEKSYRGDRDELDINDYKRIIDELYEEGLVKVCLTGGDPLRKELYGIYWIICMKRK